MASRRSSQDLAIPAYINCRYKVGRKIGEGSFGLIYEGIDYSNDKEVAIKMEPRNATVPQLRDEYNTYKLLDGTTGIPHAYYFGREGLFYTLVIDRLGPSLEDLFDMCSRRFSIKTVAMLAIHMITRVESLHNRDLIYRDIKPDNFLIGRLRTGDENSVFMIDFGMAKQYRDPKTKLHIPYRERKSLSGTARYMSINTHLGREQSRRDDLEALGHVFMYFLRGSLPWQGLKARTNKEKYEKIGSKKQSESIKGLCEGYPEEFGIYLNYARKLAFDERPDYDFLKELFRTVLKGIDNKNGFTYDWVLLGDKAMVNHHRSSQQNRRLLPLHGKPSGSRGAMAALKSVADASSPTSTQQQARRAQQDKRRSSGITPRAHHYEYYSYHRRSQPIYQIAEPNMGPPQEVESIQKRGIFCTFFATITCGLCTSCFP